MPSNSLPTYPMPELRKYIIDILRQFAPECLQRWRKSSNPKNAHIVQCPFCHHIRKETKEGTFTITADEQLYQCFACGEKGNAHQLHQKLSNGITPTVPSQPTSKSHTLHSSGRRLEGATLRALADAKGLDPSFLEDYLGWKDSDWFGTPAVMIPYYDSAGNDPQLRYRVGIRSGDRFRWQKGATLTLYGLQFIDLIRAENMSIIVEGETDAATLIYNGYNALGVPGAGNWRPEWGQYLESIKYLYFWEEPDEAGGKLAEQLKVAFPDLRVIKAPPWVKDPNELGQQTGDGFKAAMEELLDDADAAFTQRQATTNSEAVTIENSYGETSVLVQGKGRREEGKPDRPFFLHLSTLYDHPLNIRMRERQKRIIKSARALLTEKAINWCDTIEKCVVSIKAQYHPVVNEIALVPMSCTFKACVSCIWHQVENFFQKRGALLQTHLPVPVVYQIDGFSCTIQEDDEGVSDISKAEARIRKSILRMSDYEGGELGWQTATDFIDSITPVLKGNELSFSVVLLANAEPSALQMLQEHWAKETGGMACVSIVSWGNDLVGAVDEFISRSSINFDADGAVNYFRLSDGLKRRKLFQGHGVLYSMTMTRGSEKREKSGIKPDICEICGIKHIKIEHLVPIGKANANLKQAATGKWYRSVIDPANPIYDPLWVDVEWEQGRHAREAARKAGWMQKNPITGTWAMPPPSASLA